MGELTIAPRAESGSPSIELASFFPSGAELSGALELAKEETKRAAYFAAATLIIAGCATLIIVRLLR